MKSYRHLFTRAGMLTCLLLFVFQGFTATFKVMTWNIRYDNAEDSLNSWSHRKDNVSKLIAKYNPDIFGLQEVLKNQLEDIQAAMANFSHYGVGRDDGKEAGEYAPIFYNKLRFTQLDAGYFWLAENPAVPVKGWDAACIRICTWVKLQDNQDKSVIVVFNTHLDHVGENARRAGASLIKDKIRSISGRDPVFLMGDFNCNEDSKAYGELTSGKFLQDCRVTSIVPPQGPVFSFSGFNVKGKHGDIIDFILYRKFGKVLNYKIIDESKDGRYFSDHLPVFIEIAPD